MVLLFPPLFLGWKFFKKTKFIKPEECDLVWEKHIIDAYEATYDEPTVGFWWEILEMLQVDRCFPSGRQRRRERKQAALNAVVRAERRASLKADEISADGIKA
jgi:hypothetical protein